MKALLTFAIFLVGLSASAGELIYNADFAQMADMDSNSLELCGYPLTFKIDSRAPLGPTFIEKMLSKVTKVERIQATSGSLNSGTDDLAYQGPYRDKVYIVRQSFEGSYEPGVYSRFEINSYGDTNKPSGFIVQLELINHRQSAELGESYSCSLIYYKLQ